MFCKLLKQLQTLSKKWKRIIFKDFTKITLNHVIFCTFFKVSSHDNYEGNFRSHRDILHFQLFPMWNTWHFLEHMRPWTFNQMRQISLNSAWRVTVREFLKVYMIILSLGNLCPLHQVSFTFITTATLSANVYPSDEINFTQ